MRVDRTEKLAFVKLRIVWVRHARDSCRFDIGNHRVENRDINHNERETMSDTMEYTQEDKKTDRMTIRWIETAPVDEWMDAMLEGVAE